MILVPNLRLSIVVPCYNEEESIAELLRRVTGVCQSCVNDSYELVLVNDGSTDRTWSILADHASNDRHIVAVNLSRNFGHQLALTAGLSLCRGNRVLILDADLQDPPELLDDMMQRMDAGADVVFGQRIEREGETAFKKASAFLFYRILDWLSDVRIPRDTGDFRLMSRRAVNMLNAMPERYRYIRGMVSWMGLRQEAIPYSRAARFSGETKYPLRKMISFAVDAVTGFSTRPLRLATYLGFVSVIAAILLMAYALIGYFAGWNISGWTSVTMIVLAMFSMQFFILGVFGEYLGRLYFEAKQRPLFFVSDVVASPDLAEDYDLRPFDLVPASAESRQDVDLVA